MAFWLAITSSGGNRFSATGSRPCCCWAARTAGNKANVKSQFLTDILLSRVADGWKVFPQPGNFTQQRRRSGHQQPLCWRLPFGDGLGGRRRHAALRWETDSPQQGDHEGRGDDRRG